VIFVFICFLYSSASPIFGGAFFLLKCDGTRIERMNTDFPLS